MVRQPLARAGSPLAACNYHSAARPWLDRDAPPGGRGAAGRPRTKEAFCQALEAVLADGRDRHLSELSGPDEEALGAFSADHAYAAAIAAAAVGILRHRHTAGLRQRLRESAAVAVTACQERGTCRLATPCGTGQCVFASGVLRQVTAASETGRMRRPAQHAGRGFSPDDALADLEALVPFAVA
jgi:hypothetical protein